MFTWSLLFLIARVALARDEKRATKTTQIQPYITIPSSDAEQAPTARVTSRPVLELRADSTICGYWSSVGITHTVQCDAGVPCVFSSLAPGSIFGFCTHSGVQVITTGYDYGAYPAGGCQLGELCCNSNLPSYGEYIFNGVSSFFACGSTRFSQAAVTAIVTSTTMTTSSSSSSPSTTTPSTSSTNPTTSSSPTTSMSSGPTTSTSGPDSNSGDTGVAGSASTSGSAKLSTGAIVGIVIGALAVIALIALGIFFCLKGRKRNTAEDVYLQMHPSTGGEAPPYHQDPRYYDDPVYQNTMQKAS